MGLKNFCKETLEKIKEANKPENVKKRLKDQIEIESLKMKKEMLSNQRRKEKYSKSWSIGLGENK